jgi:hypothetical protein
VIAAIPVPKDTFDKGEAGPILSTFAANIETIMADPRVTEGTGTTTRDASGLLKYWVDFTVTYTDPVRAPNGASADALVPVGHLRVDSSGAGRSLPPGTESIISAVYANLQAAAGG